MLRVVYSPRLSTSHGEEYSVLFAQGLSSYGLSLVTQTVKNLPAKQETRV